MYESLWLRRIARFRTRSDEFSDFPVGVLFDLFDGDVVSGVAETNWLCETQSLVLLISRILVLIRFRLLYLIDNCDVLHVYYLLEVDWIDVNNLIEGHLVRALRFVVREVRHLNFDGRCAREVLDRHFKWLNHSHHSIISNNYLTISTVCFLSYFYLGAVRLRTVRTHDSNRDKSVVVWAIVTPTLAQNILIASGG